MHSNEPYFLANDPIQQEFRLEKEDKAILDDQIPGTRVVQGLRKRFIRVRVTLGFEFFKNTTNERSEKFKNSGIKQRSDRGSVYHFTEIFSFQKDFLSIFKSHLCD